MGDRAPGSVDGGPSVFVSYARADTHQARWIQRWLERGFGWDVWIDVEDIEGASAWAGAIEQAIGRADVVLLLHSRHSALSPMVERELSSAADQHRPIVVAEIEDVPQPPSTRFLTRSRQHVRVDGPGSDSGSQQITRLEGALRAAMSDQPEPEGRPSGCALALGRVLSVIGVLLLVAGLVGFAVVAFSGFQDPSFDEPIPTGMVMAVASFIAFAVGAVATGIGRTIRRRARVRSLR